MFKKLISLMLTLALVVSLAIVTGGVNVAAAGNASLELKVDGTKVVLVSDPTKEVRLVGVNVAGLEWSTTGDADIRLRMTVALDTWKSNLIRLPVSSEFWFGQGQYQKGDYTGYRSLVDELIQMASERGKYVILDLHKFQAPKQLELQFWQDAAVRYRNNPTVLFGLFNEPTVSWDIWRNGGTLDGVRVYGMQELIEAVRDTGANNICVVGGTNWAYNIGGILTNGGLLIDRKTGGGGMGNGIIYDTHIYPNKGTVSSWESTVKPMREVAPVIAGEWGFDAADPTVTGNYTGTAEEFETSLLDWFDKETGGYGSKMHWAAWCFHSKATPRLLKDNITCEPTDFHGQYVFNKLQSIYNQTPVETVDFVNNFNPDLFSNYNCVGENGSSISAVVANNSLNLTFDKKVGPERVLMHANIPSDWDLSRLGEIHFNISDTVLSNDAIIRLGVHERDGEDWSQSITFKNGMAETIKINIGDLRKIENQRGDGYFTGTVDSIYIEVFNKVSGSFKINSVTFRCVAAQSYQYISTFGTDITVDPGVYNGPSPGDIMKMTVVDDPDSTGGKGLEFQYARTETAANYGGNCYINMPTDNRWENLGKTRNILVRAKDILAEGSSPMSFNIRFEAEKFNVVGTTTMSFSRLIDATKKIYETTIPWDVVSWNSNYTGMTMEDRIKAIQRIRFEVSSKGSGTIMFTHLEFSGEDYPRPPRTPYKPNICEYSVDMDSKSLAKVSNYNGPSSGCSFDGAIVSGKGKNNSQAVKISYNRPTSAQWGGDCTMKFSPDLAPGTLIGSHFVSFFTRSGVDSVSRTVQMAFLDASGKNLGTASYVIPASPGVESSEWIYHKFYFSELGITHPENIKTLKFYNGTASDTGPGYYYLDDLMFSTGNQDQNISKEFKNSFDPDVYSDWSAGGSMQLAAETVSNGGIGGSGAMAISASASVPDSYVEAKLPSTWDFAYYTMTYLNFWVRGDNEQAKVTNYMVSLNDANGDQLFYGKFQSTDNDWEHIVLSLYIDGVVADLSTASTIRFYNFDTGEQVRLIIDNISFTTYKVDKVNIPRSVSYTDTFDDGTKIYKEAQYTGWGNSTANYYDYISQSFADGQGINGTKAMKIDVSAATWYSGELFLGLPTTEWNLSYATQVDFDIKYVVPQLPPGNTGGPCRKLNFRLSTGQVVNGTRWRYTVDLSQKPENEWTHITIPLSAFVLSGVSIDPSQIVGISMTPGDSGGIGDGSYGTIDYRTATIEQFNQKVKMGTFYIDNITFSSGAQTGIRVSSVLLKQDGNILSRISNGVAGNVDVTSTIDNYGTEPQTAVMVVAVYSKATNKVQAVEISNPKTIPLSAGASTEDKQITATINVTDPQNQYVKVFVWNSINGIKPIDAKYTPTAR